MPTPEARRRRQRRRARDERVLRLLPIAVIEYPLEVLLSAWGVLSGGAILAGFASPTSIARLLPDSMQWLWAGSLALAGLTIAVGLWRRQYPTAVARGLQLLGAACGVYAIAIGVVVGFGQGIPAGPLLTVIAALCYLRAWWLRARDRLLRRVEKEASR